MTKHSPEQSRICWQTYRLISTADYVAGAARAECISARSPQELLMTTVAICITLGPEDALARAVFVSYAFRTRLMDGC